MHKMKSNRAAYSKYKTTITASITAISLAMHDLVSFVHWHTITIPPSTHLGLTADGCVMVQIGDSFETMAEAKEVITRWLLDDSHRVYQADSKRIMLKCKDEDCTFRIRVTFSKSNKVAKVTVVKPYICSPLVHFKNKASSNLVFLKDHY